MSATLDITPLRSLVAIAGSGGFHRAALTLHLTQSAVSQHVRKLEQATGRQLVERSGRQTRFTPDGDQLLRSARRILAEHDDAVRFFESPDSRTLTIGASEHAAEMLLPEISSALREALPDTSFRFRLDRTAQVERALDDGVADLIVLAELTSPPAAERSRLRLCWFAAQDFRAPAGAPLPVIAFDEPCMLRRPTFDTLTAGGLEHELVAEVSNLSGGYSAARAGLGVILLPHIGRAPEGLIERTDLPEPPDVRMSVRAASATPDSAVRAVTKAVRRAMQG
ncbi:MAG TPA: LysR substrate-binding domain-containing protein [Flexivirga sp.]|uniref:LysR substrate-binding domain-containing protein n=1 Tax=Flexivirga sp. TaxID=1962927 RepID=UPI002B76605C|nr:LysR substrate-binding domain-containing protein [Flexivirga sp.]HWC23219.1 LysR substrate-binding domain-containing protein [Flexivirga sp.]